MSQVKEQTKDNLVLGRVKEINQFDLTVSLPSGQKGSIKIFDISDAYKTQLEQLVKGDEDNAENVTDLNGLFRPGQLVRCYIKSPSNLSINPRLVLNNTPKNQIKATMCFHAAVSSVEDHGYAMDLGLVGIKCFLPKDKVSAYIKQINNNAPLSIGSIVPVRISNIDSLDLSSKVTRVVQVTAEPKQIAECILSSTAPLHFGCILPGTWVKAKMVKTGTPTMGAKFQDFFISIPPNHYLGNCEEYTSKQEVIICILSVDPMSKQLSGSLLPHLLPNPTNTDAHLKVTSGTIYEDATIRRVDKRSLILWLPQPGIKAVVRKEHLSDDKSVVKNLKAHFKKEAVVKCRVLDFDFMDNMAAVTLKESIINQLFLRYDDIGIGDAVDCEIFRFTKEGVIVTVSSRIKGLVPLIHLSDAPLANPQAKYSVGDTLKCHTLRVEPGNKRLILTAKPFLVKSKLPRITDASQLKPGVISAGFVAHTTATGLLVGFYNNLKGWVKKADLGIGENDHVDQTFFRGQGVKCRVIKHDETTGKAFLSLKLDGKDEIGASKNKKLLEVDINVGEILKCEILSKSPKFMTLSIPGVDDPSITAHLPLPHLSDCVPSALLLHRTLHKGHLLEVVVVNKSATIMVSAKPSFIEAARNKQLVTNFNQLEVGSQWLGWVRNKESYGLFVEFPGGFRGLVPSKMISDGAGSQPSEVVLNLFQVGQTVEPKVVESSEEKQRCLLTLQMRSSYRAVHHMAPASLTPLEKVVQETQLVAKRGDFCRSLNKFKIGQVVRIKVKSTTDLGILSEVMHSPSDIQPPPAKKAKKMGSTKETEPGVSCVTVMSNTQGITACREGQELDAVVIYVDLDQSCLEVCLSESVVRAARSRKENKFSKIQLGQVMKSEVLLIKPDFVVAMLHGHALGRLVLLPSKRHWNDSLQINKYILGQTNQVVVKRILEDDVTICTLKIHEPIEEEPTLHRDSNTSRHPVSIGAQLSVSITHVLDFQLNVKAADLGLQGRVFVSQITNEPIQGQNPLSQYKVGQEIQVKVIGFRKTEPTKKTAKPLTKKSLFECSIIESDHKDQFEQGEKLTVYFHSKTERALFFVVNPHVPTSQRAVCSAVSFSRHISKVKHLLSSEIPVGAAFVGATVLCTDSSKIVITFLDKRRVEVGDFVCGRIKSSSGVHLNLELPNETGGFLHVMDLLWTDPIISGDRGSIEWPETSGKAFGKRRLGSYMTLRIIGTRKNLFVTTTRRSALSCSHNVKVPDSITPPSPNEETNGYIVKIANTGLLVCLTRTYNGFIHMVNENCRQLFSVGDKVTVKTPDVLPPDLCTLTLCGTSLDLLEGADPMLVTSQELKRRKLANLVAKVSGDVEGALSTRKRKHGGEEDQEEVTSDAESVDWEDGEDSVDKSKHKVTIKTVKRPVVSRSSGTSLKEILSSLATQNESESDSDNDDTMETNDVMDDKDSDDASDSDNDAMETSEPINKKIKMQKTAQSLEAIEALERRRADRLGPRTVEEFDALVKNKPDSAAAWIAYMAFYLQSSDLTKARAVAERGLVQLDVRADKERVNLFIAMLNMESTCGEAADFHRVFLRAITLSSPAIFQAAYSLQNKAGDKQLCEEIARRFVKRCPGDVEAWQMLIRSRFVNDKAGQARETLHNALSVLKMGKHVDMLTRMANLEFEIGDPSRGVKIFTEMIATYPTKANVHLSYIQTLIVAGKEEEAKLARSVAMSAVKEKDKKKFEELTI